MGRRKILKKTTKEKKFKTREATDAGDYNKIQKKNIYCKITTIYTLKKNITYSGELQ
jgi:hypothetical protein